MESSVVAVSISDLIIFFVRRSAIVRDSAFVPSVSRMEALLEIGSSIVTVSESP